MTLAERIADDQVHVPASSVLALLEMGEITAWRTQGQSVLVIPRGVLGAGARP